MDRTLFLISLLMKIEKAEREKANRKRRAWLSSKPSLHLSDRPSRAEKQQSSTFAFARRRGEARRVPFGRYVHSSALLASSSDTSSGPTDRWPSMSFSRSETDVGEVASPTAFLAGLRGLRSKAFSSASQRIS